MKSPTLTLFAAFLGFGLFGFSAACGDDVAGAPDTGVTDTGGDGGEVSPPECDAPEDCAAILGAPGVCQVAACVSGQCAFRPASAATACDDHDPCTSGDACGVGGCVGTAVTCDDQNACTRDQCTAGVGCAHVVLGGACDDADACTTGDRCQDGACAGLGVPGCGGTDLCGDGGCTGAETCATCPADCSPIGIGACGGTCNPAAPTACAPNFACVPSASGGEGACVGQAVACNPIAQTGCAAGESCLPLVAPGAGGTAFLCAPSGARVAGDACGAQSDCGPHLWCASGVCRAACDPATATCTGGVCRDVSIQFGLGTGAIGACDTTCGDGAC